MTLLQNVVCVNLVFEGRDTPLVQARRSRAHNRFPGDRHLHVSEYDNELPFSDVRRDIPDPHLTPAHRFLCDASQTGSKQSLLELKNWRYAKNDLWGPL